MKIEKFENIMIAYIRRTGEYGSENNDLMETLKKYLESKHLLNNEIVILGIALDNPNLIQADYLRYDVGYIIDKKQKQELEIRNIDDGTYAIFEVVHTPQAVQNFWNNISKYTLDLVLDYEKPIIERYTLEKINNHLCEFCVPIKL